MLPPSYLDQMPDAFVQLWQQVEEQILQDVARRIGKMDAVTPTANWQLWRYQQTEALRNDVVKLLAKYTGKSETAIELIKRGHRLVADDAVEITRIGSSLIGTAPELIRNYLEVRGVGVIDVEKLFGVGAVQDSTEIDMVIQFEKWADDKFYDRLGLDENDTTILDVPVPQVTIPVSAGRNLAEIVELAAMNNRQKKHGFNSAREFAAQIDGHIDRVTRENEAKKQNP